MINNLKKPPHGGDVWSNDVKIDFSSNINPLGPSEGLKRVLVRAVEDIYHYPDINATKLKEAISDYTGANTGNITLGNGSTELIKNFCEIFIEGGNAVIPEPTFSEYEYFSQLEGAELRRVPVETEKIIDAIDESTCVVFLCNPNNPTGHLFNEDEIQAMLEAALDSSAYVFLDEAYIEFSEGRSFANRAEEFENLFVSRSLTKFFSLAGLRIGYGVANKDVINRMEQVRIPWNVNTLAQLAGIHSLKDKKFIETSQKFIKSERAFLFSELSKFAKIKKTHANFFMVDLEGKVKSQDLKWFLLNIGILVRDCSTFTGLEDNFIRVCIRKHDENLKLLEALRSELE